MFEGVVFVAVDVRLDDQVGGLLPLRAVHFLGDGEALADDVEEVARAVAVAHLPFRCTAKTRSAPMWRKGMVGTV